MVNQALGRAIRHINDYAYVILADFRFKQMKNKLPQWVQNRLFHNIESLDQDIGNFLKNR